MDTGLSDKTVIHVSAWAKMFTQFRLPMIRRQRELFRRVLLYCPYDEAHGGRLAKEGFEVHDAPVSGRPGLGVASDIIALYGYLKRERFDVMIAHQPMGALVGITAARLAGVPVKIYSTGGLKYSPGKKGLLNTAMKCGELRIIGMSDAVFLVNREDETLLKGVPSARDKAYYVGPRGGCGVDTARFNPEDRAAMRGRAREYAGIGDGDFAVGYVGRCVWYKGLRDLIDAAAILRGRGAGDAIKFLILGEGEDLPEIKEYVSAKGLDPYFIFMGYRFDVESCMSAFDLFVLPSYREGLPVALLDAMALGIPSVATDIRGSRELISDGDTGLLVPPGNPERLAEAVMSIRQSPDRGAALGSRASGHILGNYGEKTLLDNTMGIIGRLVTERCGGG